MKIMKRATVLILVVILLAMLPIHEGIAHAVSIPAGLEQTVVDALENRASEIDIQQFGLSVAEWRSIYYEILDTNPQLWFVERGFSYYSNSSQVTKILPYYMNENEAQAISDKVEYVISNYTYSWMSDLEKALALHDYMLLHSEYDLTYSKYSAYDNLILGTSVCQGYAEAYAILLGEVGISSRIVTSDAMNHAWNLVYIDGAWYHVDVTWDDPISDLKGRARHAHFMLSDAGIRNADHYGWQSDIACTSTKYDDGAYWANMESAIIFQKDQKSILRYDGMGAVKLVRRDHTNGTETVLYENNNSRYNYNGGMWYTVTRGLSSWNGKLYFNDLSNVYTMPVGGGEAEKLYAIEEIGGGHYIASTCVSGGKLYVTVRDHQTNQETVKVLAIADTHSHSYQQTFTAATCTQPGKIMYICECGDSYSETISPTGHTEVVDAGVAATCTQSGLSEGSHCSVCGEIIVAQQILPATGHTYVLESVEPTCTQPGSVYTVCACGDRRLVEEIPAPGHSWDGGKVTIEPGEYTPGEMTYTCVSCGMESAEIIPALGHTHSHTAVTTAPTCTAQGFTTYTCACGDSYVADLVEAKGHTEVIVEAAAPSCTVSGLTEGKYCAVCGEVITVQEEIPAAGHSWNDGVITKEPTETTEGIRTYTCTVCGETQTETVPTLEHTHAYTPTVTEPTCTETGFTTYTCACGDSYVTDYVDALGHIFGLWIIDTESVLGGAAGTKHRVCECGQTEYETYTNPLIDVPNGKYFSKPVFWAYENGITKGKTATEFQLDADCTRKQIVMFLWRAAGEPEPKSMENPFVDVKADSFEKAILWAYYEGITSGKTATEFQPEAPCTREQIVMFLWRYFGKPEPQSMVNPFTDVRVGGTFEKAILWAYYEGITTGKTATTFEPQATCTRGQIVTFLYRAMVE